MGAKWSNYKILKKEVEDVYSVKFKYGRELKCTATHQLKKETNVWTALKDLNIGDWALSNFKVKDCNFDGVKKIVGKDLSKANTGIPKKETITFKSKDLESL